MSVAGFVFQACLIDHSSISPFRINDLRTVEKSVVSGQPWLGLSTFVVGLVAVTQFAAVAAYAIGPPAGTVLYASCGVAAVGFAAMLLSLATVGLVMPLRLAPWHGAALIVLSLESEMATNSPLETALSAHDLRAVSPALDLAFYSGWPNAMAAAAAAADVFARRGIDADQLPPASPDLLPLDEAAEADGAARVEQQMGAIMLALR